MKIVKYFGIFVFIFLVGCKDKIEVSDSSDNITDDLHKKLEFLNPPQRIITLAPNLTELVFELGLGSKIVGNTSYCNFPDSAKKIEKVADLLTVNLEKITTLQPDLIFISAEGNSKSEYDKLVDLGYKVFVSNPRHYSGIKKTLLDMGKIFDVSQKAQAIVNNWEDRIETVKSKHDQLVFSSVMFLMSTNPIISVGKNSFIHQILTFTGLENISADTEISYPMYNREELLVRNPDYILLFETNNNDINTLLKDYPEWHTLSAVINNRVFYLNADLYSRPGPRFVDAVEDLHNLILSR
jgi:ABC-type Fe3+-hydroxamate transport system substrate-binding protein